MNEQQMTLATDLHGQSMAGWLASEKLDGCRAYWDGAQFWTRGGNVIPAPSWFTAGLPAVALDGELWAGRSGFQAASNAARLGGHWFEVSEIEFAAFDFPGLIGPWPKRMAEARKALEGCAHARAIPFIVVRDAQHFVEFMLTIRRRRGEGGMFRNPDSLNYETGRSENLRRFKFCDCL